MCIKLDQTSDWVTTSIEDILHPPLVIWHPFLKSMYKPELSDLHSAFAAATAAKYVITWAAQSPTAFWFVLFFFRNCYLFPLERPVWISSWYDRKRSQRLRTWRRMPFLYVCGELTELFLPILYSSRFLGIKERLLFAYCVLWHVWWQSIFFIIFQKLILKLWTYIMIFL